MRRITVLSTVLALALALVFFGTPPAVHAGGGPNPIKTALQAGGDRLADLQNADGGWFFTVGDVDCGFGAGVSCPNTFGITAMGVLHAYLVTKDADHLAAAVATGDALVAKKNAAPPCDSDPDTGDDRPFTVDVAFLMELASAVKQGKTYKTAGTAWFQCVMKDFPNAADRADNRIARRVAQNLTNLGEWDAALDIEAALAVGQKKYAEAEALRVIAREGDWDVADPDCPGCELLGKGLLMHVLKPIAGNSTIKAAIAAWAADLTSAQDPAGSWASDTQTTAYVLMGLSTVKKTAAVKTAIDKGLLYLFGEAIGNGGYFIGTGSGDEITEVDSEVLQALYIYR